MHPISTTQKPIQYPETAGKPIAETDVHIDVLIYLREALRDHFADDPRVYVAGSMLLCREEGNPEACLAPNVFVVQGWLWESGGPPK
jgi:hypothetical protein